MVAPPLADRLRRSSIAKKTAQQQVQENPLCDNYQKKDAKSREQQQGSSKEQPGNLEKPRETERNREEPRGTALCESPKVYAPYSLRTHAERAAPGGGSREELHQKTGRIKVPGFLSRKLQGAAQSGDEPLGREPPPRRRTRGQHCMVQRSQKGAGASRVHI